MKNKFRKLITVFTVFFAASALLAPPVKAAAAPPPLSVHYEGYAGGQGVLSLYLNTNHTEPLDSVDFSVSLSGQPLECLGIDTAADRGGGVSWIFAVDVSGSVQSDKMDLLRRTVSAIVENFGENDNAAFILIGNDVQTVPFSSDQSEILSYVAAIETLPEDTNLYKGIVRSVQVLQTDTAVNKKRCAVIFSDGEDDIVEGFTREEAEQAVESAHIPVFTVALQNANPGAGAVESAKILSGFSRKSAGGLNFTLSPASGDPAAIAGAVSENINGGYILDLSLRDISLPQDQGMLEIRLTAAGQKAEQSLMLNTAELRAYITAAATEPTPEPAADPALEPEPESGPGLWPIWACVGAVLLMSAILLLWRRSRRQRRAAAGSPAASEEAAVPEEAAASAPKDAEPVPAATGAVRPQPRFRFSFVKIGLSENQAYTADMAGELVIGRNTGQLTVPSDPRLSARHCRIFPQNGEFYLEDLRSTNGTYLNGVPVAGIQKLEQDNILLIGSSELRVTWREL